LYPSRRFRLAQFAIPLREVAVSPAVMSTADLSKGISTPADTPAYYPRPLWSTFTVSMSARVTVPAGYKAFCCHRASPPIQGALGDQLRKENEARAEHRFTRTGR